MTQIAVIGPGAIGCTVAAWLMQNSAHDVMVAARTAIVDLEIETTEGVLKAAPRVIAHVDAATRVDWVLVTTKAYDANGAAAWFKGLCDAGTIVAVLQNGVEHVERFAPYIAREHILPVMVDLPAERTAPGRVRQRNSGRMVVPQGGIGAGFVELFSHTHIAVSQSTDFKTEVWSKLCINSVGALSAILLKPAVIAHHEGVAQIMRGIVRECIAVGRAEGALLPDSLTQSVLAGYRSAAPDSLNSLHADRLAGRRMEIDARNGVIVRLGHKHGIPTPLNTMVVALLEATSV